MKTDPYATIAQLGRALRSRQTSVSHLIQACLARIEQLNPKLNAFVAVYRERSLHIASSLEQELRAGHDRGPLHGIPIAIKANIDMAGEISDGCSHALRDNLATADAACVARLRQAGAIIIGKTNMHELAYGGTGQISVYGPARNPWDIERNAGGSSSGSGVAVAAGMVPAALGTDTGGSIRIPAAACGVVGFKPTLGAVSTQGVLPLSWTLDHVGPLARNVQDAHAVFAALTAHYQDRAATDTCSVQTIGIANFPGYALAPEIQARLDITLKALEDLGYRIEPFSLQYTREAHRAWLGIMYAEASCRYETTLLQRYTDFHPSIRTQLETGRYLDAMTYLKAQRFRSFFSHYYAGLLERYDLIAAPTLPTVAPGIGQETVDLPGRTVATQDAMTFTNLTANMLGWPAISIPMGLTCQQLPAGLTFMSKPWQDVALLDIAQHLERVITPPDLPRPAGVATLPPTG